MPLYEVAILEHPTVKEVEEGTSKEKLAFGPEFVIATDPKAAGISAVMDSRETIKVARERMQVLVRPFV